jgi:hypothetical protein
MEFVNRIDFEIDIRKQVHSFLYHRKGMNWSLIIKEIEQTNNTELFEKYLFFQPIYYPNLIYDFPKYNCLRVRVKMEKIWLYYLNEESHNYWTNVYELTKLDLIKEKLVKYSITVDDSEFSIFDFRFNLDFRNFQQIRSTIFLSRRIARNTILKKLFPYN